MVRVFARCGSVGEAPGLEAQLLQALAAFQAVPQGTPQRYGKMPELFEFTFTAPGAQHLAAMVSLCPQGWAAFGDEHDLSWVWNAQPGATLLHGQVRWAELLLVD